MLLVAEKHFLLTVDLRMLGLFFIGGSPLDIFWCGLLCLDIPSDFDNFTIGKIVLVWNLSQLSMELPLLFVGQPTSLLAFSAFRLD